MFYNFNYQNYLKIVDKCSLFTIIFLASIPAKTLNKYALRIDFNLYLVWYCIASISLNLYY